jgi:hypothetical protein
LSVIAGAQRFAHTNQLRADRALHALLGMKRFPSDDTILNYFRRFSQAEVERFRRLTWRWLISGLPQLEASIWSVAQRPLIKGVDFPDPWRHGCHW